MWLLLLFLYCNCFYTVFSSEESGLVCNEDNSLQSCEKFTILDRNDPSIFILHAEGRLGNHLMAFAIVMALAKSLNIRYFYTYLYGNMGCRFFKERDTKLDRFSPKINTVFPHIVSALE